MKKQKFSKLLFSPAYNEDLGDWDSSCIDTEYMSIPNIRYGCLKKIKTPLMSFSIAQDSYEALELDDELGTNNPSKNADVISISYYYSSYLFNKLYELVCPRQYTIKRRYSTETEYIFMDDLDKKIIVLIEMEDYINKNLSFIDSKTHLPIFFDKLVKSMKSVYKEDEMSDENKELIKKIEAGSFSWADF